jgi:hypothetical protein
MNKAKRLQPVPETLRELFLKSGNLCAFPGCSALMIDLQGVFIGQVCHIEAAEEGGERFNPKMTNDERRAFTNLMLMCYPHHKVTNDVRQYPVAKLREMKRDHERRFSDPSRSMLEKLIDWTLSDSPTSAKSLRGYNQIAKWESRSIP